MTPGNKTRLLQIEGRLKGLRTSTTADVQSALLTLMDVQRDLLVIQQDLVFRPEVNEPENRT